MEDERYPGVAFGSDRVGAGARETGEKGATGGLVLAGYGYTAVGGRVGGTPGQTKMSMGQTHPAWAICSRLASQL